MWERGAALIATLRRGPLAPFLTGDPPLEVDAGEPDADDASQAVVLAAFRLQDIPDYRLALRAWFRPVRIGGNLVLLVPHAFLHERQLALPSPWRPGQRRIYTPRSLLEEVEEALAPNSYRVRYLSDLDEGYDYALDTDEAPVGDSAIALVLERIALPSWQPSLVPDRRPLRARLGAPDYAFEPGRTRVEVATLPPRRRVLILKPDHLGDFIMSLAALERARALFADSEITLVVGSWNVDMARELNLADKIVPFDVFPRNSSEEEVDVPGKADRFRATVTEEYDIAIDLRGDHDTRFLLRLVRAKLRAGIGTRAQFPFLDIFLPIDFTRNEPESAREYLFELDDFPSQGPTIRSDYRIVSVPATVERHCAILWGPYKRLRPGRYIFEPYLEFEPSDGGLLMLDVGLDAERVAQKTVERADELRLSFTVEMPDVEFEFRIWTVDDAPAIGFSFFGGRLIREGGASVLHQSEYGALLLELVALRVGRSGVLTELAAP